MGFFDQLNKFEGLLDSISPTVSLDTFFESVSERVDEQIKNQEMEGKHFVGGKTFFSLSGDEKYIIIETKIYYTTNYNDYKMQENSGRFSLSRIHTQERSKMLELIRSNGKLCVEIDEPM